jgi:hypothetical protein
LAFFITPVAGEIAPGVPTPTEHIASTARSPAATSAAIASIVPS